ncbi:hypothetical protein C2G38_2114531 [Gigaspora rosea]|uniref:Uncharacterized protein n=1 Tax=Gigaspora rosea TaxID=44941 RepID=A0A397UA10_9GLOM|nr:hypothetical protein C2G38_2114531 [Gigaspora rosea]
MLGYVYYRKSSLPTDIDLGIDRKRHEALAETDNAKFGWLHIRTCIVAGVGFLSDAFFCH